MSSFFKSFKSHISRKDDPISDSGSKISQSSYYSTQPPEWAPAPEKSHAFGRISDAPEEDYQAAIDFCLTYPLSPPVLVPSHAVDRIRAEGSRAWGIEIPDSQGYRRFSGRIENIPPASKSPGVVRVTTDSRCSDFCLLSDLPIIAGLYDVSGRTGVYFEVKIHKMNPPRSLIAIGTACRPYPLWRLPGWNRESSGLHLDDMRKFFEDPDGGRDYDARLNRVSPGDTIGCGYIYATGSLFYTWNGSRLGNAFDGIHLPRQKLDVFAAIGVVGAVQFDVNFGGELFRWKEGNEWHWKVDGLVGRLTDIGGPAEDLPAYSG